MIAAIYTRKSAAGGRDGWRHMMGWFLRKSLRLGPLRLNLSKSGLGISTGIKGLRASVDAKGRRYVAGGRGGLYFREYVRPEATPREPASVAPGPVKGRSSGWAWFWFVVAVVVVAMVALTR